MDESVAWMISAEPGWKALFGIDGDEVGRSRVIGWAGIAEGHGTRLVGVVVDPNDPARLVAADSITDTSGGELMRYGFAR